MDHFPTSSISNRVCPVNDHLDSPGRHAPFHPGFAFKRCQLDIALELAIKPVVTLFPFHTTDQQEGLSSRDAGHRVASWWLF